LAVHAIVTIPVLLWVFARRNPARYVLTMATPLLTAFSTSSSLATLPLTMEAAEGADVSSESTDFVLPVGATVNMDGTALYEAMAAIFVAQSIGLDLSFAQLTVVVITAALAAIGAAGIPEAGLVTLVIVLRAVDLPLDGLGLLIALDWLIDRFRTTVNVWGDATGAAVVDRIGVPDEDEPDDHADSQVNAPSSGTRSPPSDPDDTWR
jgi:Na+/H+-dicarboxylate symporter